MAHCYSGGMVTNQVTRFGILALCASLAFDVSGLCADIKATDENIPSSMNAGGTAEDYATYILGTTGPVTRDYGPNSGAFVGPSTSYNHLIIQSGSTMKSHYGWIGSTQNAHHNIADVIGSTWEVANRIDVGVDGSYNRLSITAGSQVSAEWAYVGLTATASNNTLNLLGNGSKLNLAFSMTVGSSGPNNTLNVGDGAQLFNGLQTVIGSYDNANNNQAFVYGRGSLISTPQLRIGGEDLTGNSLTLSDAGLVRISEYWDINYALFVSADTGNFMNFDGGFLAIEGDFTSHLADLIGAGAFRLWDGSNWQIGSLNDFIFGYYDEADAFAFTGYEGLGGYTILTNVSVIPEPSTYAALVGCAALGLAAFRRHRRRGAR